LIAYSTLEYIEGRATIQVRDSC